MSSYRATNFTCQLWQPKKKSADVFVSPQLWGLFQPSCFEARCSMRHTERISITNMLTGLLPTVASPLSYRDNSPFKVCPYSNYTFIALKTNDHSFSNKQLKTWHFCCLTLIVPQLLTLRAIKSGCILLTITSTYLWLIKRRITSISLWRIEYFCIVKGLVSSSEGSHCPFLSSSPLEHISVYWTQ